MKRFKMNIICGKTSSKIYRDGLYRDFWSQGCCPPSFFRPGQRALFKDYTTSENIFQKSITESGFSCSQKDSLIPAGQKFDQPEMHSFWVDSMRFDTIYVNKLLIEKRNSYYVQRDTFCLKETMRLQLNHDEYNYIGLIEQAEIFKEPTCESAPLFTQSEIDKCKKLIITGYLKDSAGVEWIKISLDAIVFNEELEIEELKYFEGWILQKTLQVN